MKNDLMKQYLTLDEWKIVEEGFDPEKNRISESLFSLGNGRMGQRANFEESYSGNTLRGNYIGGVYYPDKTRVGWWKNGYPEYFAKVLNAANWIGIDIDIEGEKLDLSGCKITYFRRELNMKEGYLLRVFEVELPSTKKIQVKATRFLSMARHEVGVIKYSVVSLNFNGRITITPYIDFDVKNQDANYDEKFWEEISHNVEFTEGYVTARTKKLDFHVCTAMNYFITQHGSKVGINPGTAHKEKYVSSSMSLNMKSNEEITIYKYAAICSSLNHPKEFLVDNTLKVLREAMKTGFDVLMDEHKKAWEKKWQESDIVIDGDVAAQQGIRFNIFQLYQTYTGDDERLNIGPKGFTGEKYGGSTYWDTEAYCLPFYMSTADEHVARNLLLYRYKHLRKAIENAQKLGFTGGAALFPMVTMNGEECHNEWEITFEEIHRNGAIAYAIFNYVRYTGHKEHLIEYGLEVLIAIARFWAQRVNFSIAKNKYVILGTTGPNEYENNVNNNWYTNRIASWSMEYAMEAVSWVSDAAPEKYAELTRRISFDHEKEMDKWKHIIENMYYPVDEINGVFLQQDGYLDKEQLEADDLPREERPINQHWSWDRILRSCFIKQADVLQGLFFLEDLYDQDTLRRNFDFYEPRTVHESSLSPCVHSILAARLGEEEKAYNLYLRTARLDLDDYNNEAAEGCHITSMAGTWMSVVMGFGGMRIVDDKLVFRPFIPRQWKSYSFKIHFRAHIVSVKVSGDEIFITNQSENKLTVNVFDQALTIGPGKSQAVEHHQAAGF
jgi:maltose phosphorylase